MITLVNSHYDLVVDQVPEDWERGRGSQELGHMQGSWGWWRLKWACWPSRCLKALEICKCFLVFKRVAPKSQEKEPFVENSVPLL